MTTALQNQFEHTVQLTREWSDGLAAHLNLGDEQRTSLQIIRDWLRMNEPVQWGAQFS